VKEDTHYFNDHFAGEPGLPVYILFLYLFEKESLA